MTQYEWRDIHPDGNVLSAWLQPEGQTILQDDAQFGPGGWPPPPWDRQRRELPDGEWLTLGRVREDGIRWDYRAGNLNVDFGLT